MVLFVSDMHFGRSSKRTSEVNLINCLRAHQDQLTHLVLGGDVFDAYIEYRTLVPKGCARFMGFLAELADRGIPISYVAGNHDFWHLDYFESELGVHIVRDAFTFEADGLRIFATHGDALPGTSWITRAAKTLMHHPIPCALYRNLIPSDWGMRFARIVKRRLDTRPDTTGIAQILRNYARYAIQNELCDIIVMGHSHIAELTTWPNGSYLNTGSWYKSCFFGTLTNHTLQLKQWDGQNAHVVQSTTMMPSSTLTSDSGE